MQAFRNIEESIKYLRDNSQKRGFDQTFDLIASLRNIDLKKPENKFSKDIALPHGRGNDVEVGIISNSIPGALKKEDVENLANDKAAMKKVLRKYEFFVCEAPLMPLVGKTLGRFLGPKGKMPK
ncbi:MAG: 50S ribosomal protein L1, partial [Candidatus Aenigmarchaeota archaeon]|nr:50S ribosomal protein L1 [Candidatus Aenigmarchaeota archaeon]